MVKADQPLATTPAHPSRLRASDVFTCCSWKVVVEEEDGGLMSGLRSLVTVLLYLNDGGGRAFRGGETAFLDFQDGATQPSLVEPRCGRAVIFEHALWHAGLPLKPPLAAAPRRSPPSQAVVDNPEDSGCRLSGRT